MFTSLWTAAGQAFLSFTISQSLLKFMSTELVVLSNHLIFCCPLLFFCLLSFPASGSFPMSQLFVTSGQSIGPSASISVLSMNIQGWFPLGLIDLLAVQGTLKSLSPAPQCESISSSVLSLLYGPILTSIHDYWKDHSLDYKLLLWRWNKLMCKGLNSA